MRPLKAVYRKLASTHLTLILLIMLVFCMLLGTIFPQGGKSEQYAEAFGKVRAEWFTRLGLFDIFHSWYFLVLGGLFFLNLVFCSVEGWRSYARPRLAAFKEAGTTQWDIGKEQMDALVGALRHRKYRIRRVMESESASSIVAQRGLPSRPVSIIYHFGLALTFVGFALSALTVFDGEVYLFPGETKRIPVSSPDMTFNRWRERLGWSAGEPDSLSLYLESFRTEYTWYNVRYYPREWKSDVTLTVGPGIQKKKVIEVNAPLRYRGITIYQMSYSQEFDVELEDTAIHVKSGEPFEVPGIDGRFSVRNVRTGTLFKEGYRQSITPHADLYFKTPDAKRGERVGRLTLDSKYYFKDTSLTMRNFTEASGLYFRRDEGVVFLYIAFFLFMIGLFMRIFLPSYRISVYLDWTERKAYLSAKVAGVAAYQSSELDAIHEKFREMVG